MSDLDCLYKIHTTSPTKDSFNRLFQAVHAECLRLVRRDEDAAQQAAIVVLQKLPTFIEHGEDSFSRYVRRIAKLGRLSAYKHQAINQVELGEDQLDTKASKRFVDCSTLPHGIKEIAELLLEGWTQSEVASRLGISPTALRKRLSRYRHSTS